MDAIEAAPIKDFKRQMKVVFEKKIYTKKKCKTFISSQLKYLAVWCEFIFLSG